MPAQADRPAPRSRRVALEGASPTAPVAPGQARPESAGASGQPGRERGRLRRRTRVRLLLLSDVVGAALVANLAALVLGGGRVGSLVSAAIVLATPVALAAVGAYRPLAPVPGAGLRRVGHYFLAAGLCTWFALVVSVLTSNSRNEKVLIGVWLVLPLVWWLGRLLLAAVAGRPPQNVVVIGTGDVARRAIALTERSRRSLDLVGVLDDDPLPLGPTGPPLLGRIDELPAILERHDVDRVLVTFSSRRDEDLLPILRECDELGVRVDVVQRFFEYVGLDAQPSALGDLPVTGVPEHDLSPADQAAKRLFDLVAASVGLALLSPVLALCALAIVLEDGFPVLFRQERVGRRGEPFEILKFRTMRREGDAEGLERVEGLADGTLSMAEAAELLKPVDDPRVTRVGRFLRRTSLDELPQLWNVVRGEMSLVGPRPLRDFEVESLDLWQLVRNDVRPGLTGLWQVMGRSDMSWPERLQLDYGYVRHWSLSSDVRVLAETPRAVLRGHGAY